MKMLKAFRTGLFWVLIGGIVVPPLIVVLAASDTETGFAFTPRWSAVFALWLLSLLSLAVHLIAKIQFDPDPITARNDALANEEKIRKAAVASATTAAQQQNPATDASAQQAAKQAVAASTATASVAVRTRRVGIKSLVIGADGRASTSKVGAAVWTYAILFAFAYMLVLGQKPIVADDTPRMRTLTTSFEEFIDAGFQPEYFALLGLPLAAAVTAKALVSNKVVTGELSKVPGEGQGVATGVAELVTNDTGQTDLVDFQYVAFNLFTLIYFFVAFATVTAEDPKLGLPAIPATLLALSGVSTTGYLFKKATEQGVAPQITSVTPMRVVLGSSQQSIWLVGKGFLSKGKTVTAANQVLLDGKALATKDWRETSVEAQLPVATSRTGFEELGWRERTGDTPAELIVRDDAGNSSPVVKVEVGLPA
jgi:hypothetical protein